ncbi:MAG TPA: hypothetical protein ENH11_04380 [Candidatus Acetothermia bacterium]|nr:hypothetical protein [Candidatus Acetothermia bacterium]
MKKYKVTILVPQSRIIEAVDLKAAGEEGSRFAHINNVDERAPKVLLYSVIQEKELVEKDFGPAAS